MLSAACPRCGAPAPLSLAAPDRIHCRKCHYVGSPPEEVRVQAHAALQTLWQLDEHDRQLTGLQRLNVRSAHSYFLVVLALSSVLVLPLVVLAGGCACIAATSDTPLEPGNVLLLVVGFLPVVLGVAAAALALRHLSRRGRALALRCAAVPPEVAGEPARCHVCGAPLEVSARSGVTRCGFCRADNLVSHGVLARIGQRRQAHAGHLVGQVRDEGRSLDRSALVAGLGAVVTIVAAPALGFVALIVVAIVGSSIETEPLPGAVYVFVPVSHTRCVAQLESSASGPVARFWHRRPDTAQESNRVHANWERKSGAELVGHVLSLPTSRQGRVRRLYRDVLTRSRDQVELDVDGRKESIALVGLCEPTAKRRVVADNPHFAETVRVFATGDHVFVATRTSVLRYDKAGGAPTVLLRVAGPIRDLRLDGSAVLLLHQTGPDQAGNPGATATAPDATATARAPVWVLERREGEHSERLAEEVNAFSVHGSDIVYGTASGLYRRSGEGVVEPLYRVEHVSVIAAYDDALYFVARGRTLYERNATTGAVRELGNGYSPNAIARLGNAIFIADQSLPVSYFPLPGGERVELDVRSISRRDVQTDGQRVYYGRTSGDRGGVLALAPGARSTTGAHHYGIETREPTAFAVGKEEIFFIDGSKLLAEPVLPQ